MRDSSIDRYLLMYALRDYTYTAWPNRRSNEVTTIVMTFDNNGAYYAHRISYTVSQGTMVGSEATGHTAGTIVIADMYDPNVDGYEGTIYVFNDTVQIMIDSVIILSRALHPEDGTQHCSFVGYSIPKPYARLVTT